MTDLAAKAVSDSQTAEVVVTAQRRETDTGVGAAAPRSHDPGARLRHAAVAGRIAAVEALLARGAPIDAPDARGETALMKSIRAHRLAVIAVLRRHGADLDVQNRAGKSPRNTAAARNDPALDDALGLDPRTP